MEETSGTIRTNYGNERQAMGKSIFGKNTTDAENGTDTVSTMAIGENAGVIGSTCINGSSDSRDVSEGELVIVSLITFENF